jgi:hydroxymethylglutaryl-CoA reductase
MQILNGFSKLSIAEKSEILKQHVPLESYQTEMLTAFHDNLKDLDDIIINLSENYVTNYVLPFGIVPNFRVNDKWYFIPMVTEESSVVAAASYAAKFWSSRGGFNTQILGTKKSGQVYFSWNGSIEKLENNYELLKNRLLASVKHLTANMEKRGGGITGFRLRESNSRQNDYYIIDVDFETADSMGANLINTCLETIGMELISYIKNNFGESDGEAEVIMAILSNYTPDCLVECKVECDISQLSPITADLSPEKFAVKFMKAVQIADENVVRAVTHNKGIFNGIDAVLLATANDFRAVEACGHAYASRDGIYRALTHIELNNRRFTYTLRVPLSLGTVGGATSVHPMARIALQIMQNPSAKDLMQLAASAGLANSFSAIRSLITSGIQKGHMKLHLSNILTHFNVNESEKNSVKEYFNGKPYSFNAVSDYLKKLRETK